MNLCSLRYRSRPLRVWTKILEDWGFWCKINRSSCWLTVYSYTHIDGCTDSNTWHLRNSRPEFRKEKMGQTPCVMNWRTSESTEHHFYPDFIIDVEYFNNIPNLLYYIRFSNYIMHTLTQTPKHIHTHISLVTFSQSM